MATDYCAFVPVVNRPDLLGNIISTTKSLRGNFTVIDNSPNRWVQPHLWNVGSNRAVYTPPVPFSFTQTMNWEMEETARQGMQFCVHMHSDAIIPEGVCEELLSFARNIHKTNPKWGVIFTLYDILAVYNPKAFQDIGGYDTTFAAYFSDQDWYRRLVLAGWERIESHIEVGHVGSQTINSDTYLRHLNSVTFPLYREYYQQKWGGPPGEEAWMHPFGIPPESWSKSS